jgi:hypothetical protein
MEISTHLDSKRFKTSYLDKCVHLRGDIFRKMIATGREEMCENPSKEALSQLDLRYSITVNATKYR